MRIAAKSISALRQALLPLGLVLFEGALLAAEEPVQLPAAAGSVPPSAEAIVRELAARSVSWTTARRGLESLEYDFIAGSDVTPVRVRREQRRNSVWMGTTLHAGLQSLVKFTDRYTISLTRQPGAKTITLLAKPKNATEHIAVEIGNGVENSWRGYSRMVPRKRPSSWTPSGSCRSRNTPVRRMCVTPNGKISDRAAGCLDGLT